ncbi:adenylylsulfate kinase [Desulfocucumis palustris]|uniref:Adenylyl-sulfate kinase n=1 Tax=Desulfocucumis palustris TaxID=1898651 RepID=A0A2L2XKJ5_9FIRM|nr:adenylyl-sulfate kinase [Desulfocucumis palustris]GBF34806.1 adenylylsulfate kinase [Desulfocucumis palustris]
MNIVKAINVVWHDNHLECGEREKSLGQQGCTIWLTGLPSSGKSTISFLLERELIKRGYITYVLDGDNIRHGLNKNLGFSKEDREENVRRVGEVAKLFADAGLIVVASLISPYQMQRNFVRNLHESVGLSFIEVFVDAPPNICECRDPKGLYKKARMGELKGFTGVDDPYEPPVYPEIVVKTAESPPNKCADKIITYLLDNGYLKSEYKYEANPPGILV